MALSIFIDALPYSEMSTVYKDWFKDEQLALLQPNVGYSSSLHWQLYCNKYPDERMRFLDWGKVPEKNEKVIRIAKMLKPLDSIPFLSFFARKVYDRFILKEGKLAFIPFKFRHLFSSQSKYLFWDKETYSQEKNFAGYMVISQDEQKCSFERMIELAKQAILEDKKDIFINFGFADFLGHRCARGEYYDEILKPYMNSVKEIIELYLSKHEKEEVLIVSDHGMSTIEKQVNLHLEKKFGKQSQKNYIAYVDSCVLCVWSDNKELLTKMSEYLASLEFGHLLTGEERKYYKNTNEQFGNIIFILKEGYVFANSWFGQSKRKHPHGQGMHGFWPELEAKNQMATIFLLSSKRRLKNIYNYEEAYHLISSVMQKEIK